MPHFVEDIKGMCGALLHAIWKVDNSENPDEISLDLAQEILCYLRSLRQHESVLDRNIAALLRPNNDPIEEKPNNKHGKNQNDSSHEERPPQESTESKSVEKKDAVLDGAVAQETEVDESMNEDEKIAHDDNTTEDRNAKNDNAAKDVNINDDIKAKNSNHIDDIEDKDQSGNDDNTAEENLQIIDTQNVTSQVNDNCHVLNLVTHAIGQLECDIQQNNEETASQPVTFGIQAEVVVTTTQDEEQMDVVKRSKRKPKPKEEVEQFLKRRRSMDMRIISHSDISSSNDTIAPAKSNDAAGLKLEKAMKKRLSPSRKTICGPRPKIEKFEDEIEAPIRRRNTDQKMYANNPDYRVWCELCKKPQVRLAAHYVRDHPDYEVLISRPSPQIADILRRQSQKFTQNKGKIAGVCLFCEENKCMPKTQWAHHLLTHTGEKMFACSDCDTTFKHKGEHKKVCSKEPVNIYLANSERSIVGFMCKDCNYLQLNRTNMIKHVKNEHGYMASEENCHYEQHMLIPELSTNSQSGRTKKTKNNIHLK